MLVSVDPQTVAVLERSGVLDVLGSENVYPERHVMGGPLDRAVFRGSEVQRHVHRPCADHHLVSQSARDQSSADPPSPHGVFRHLASLHSVGALPRGRVVKCVESWTFQRSGNHTWSMLVSRLRAAQ